MKVKNNTNKPIGIGVLNLLPGKTETLPAPYENHPVVKMLSTKKFDDDHTFITLIKDKKSAKASTEDVAEETTEATAEEVTGEATGEKKTGKAKPKRSNGAETGSEE